MTSTRRILALAALAAGLALTLTCSPDEPVTPGGSGRLHLVARIFQEKADAGARGLRGAGAPDTIRVRVSDASGRHVAGATGAIDEEGRFRLEIDLGMGGPFTASAVVEAAGFDPRDPGSLVRAGLYLGSTGAFEIRAGETTRDTLDLRSLLTGPRLASGQAGDLSYSVVWRRIADAAAYDLLAIASPSGTDFVWQTADTSRTFDLTELAGAFGHAAGTGEVEEVVFWVRARTPPVTGHFADSIRVPVGAWKNLPRVTAVTPAGGTSDVPDSATVLLGFSSPMDGLDLLGGGIRLSEVGGAAVAEGPRRVADDGRGVRLVPLGFLPNEALLEVRVDPSVRGADGRPFDQDPEVEGLQDFASRFTVERYLRLGVTEVDPPDGTTGVDRRAVLTLSFTRPADPLTLDRGVALTDSAGVPAAVLLEPEGETVLKVEASQNLAWGGLYTLTATAEVRDLRGLPLDQDPETPESDPFAMTFRVLEQPLGPAVDSSVPAHGVANVRITANPVVVFSRPVDPSTVTAQSFSLRKEPNYFNVSGTILADPDDRRFTFSPTSLLERGLRYRIVVTPAVADPEGIPLDQDRFQEGFQEFVSEFKAEDNPIVEEVAPGGGQNVAVDSRFTLRFSLPLDPATVDGSTVVLSRTTGGAVVPAAVKLDGDGVLVTLVPGDSLRFVTGYTLTATTDIRSAEGSLLDQNRNTAVYDPFTHTFTTEVDSTPPRVAFVDPPDGAEGLSESATVAIRFARPIKPSTVNGSTFLLCRILAGGDSTVVPGTIMVAPDSVNATLTPDDLLDFDATYRVWVKRLVTSPHGINLDQDVATPGDQPFRSEFRTRIETDSPQVVSVHPADGATQTDPATAVRIVFDEPVRPESVAGGFRLLGDGGVLSGDGLLGADSLEWIFQPSDTLDLLATYSVEVDTTVLDRVGNPLDQDPAADGLQAFSSMFTTVGDTVSPRVLAIDPPDGAQDVGVTAPVTLTMSEAIDPATVTASTVTVGPDGGDPAAGGLTVLDGGETIRWTPAVEMAPGTLHRVLVTSGVADPSGNPLDQDPGTEADDPFEAFFTTEPETVSPGVDAFFPQGGGIEPHSEFGVVFTEPIDPETIIPGGVDVTLQGIPQDVLRRVSDSRDSVYVRAVTSLVELMQFEFRVTSVVTDTLGNPFDDDPDFPGYQTYVHPFHVGEDDTPPFVMSVQPPDSAVGVATAPDIEVVFSERMARSTIDFTSLFLTPGSGSISFTVELLEDDRTAVIDPQKELTPGEIYTITADALTITDLNGVSLDQDPLAEGNQSFMSIFTVGFPPILVLPDGICRTGDDTTVDVDATASSDPDGEIVSVTWDWGDGVVETLDAPGGLLAQHAYACTDAAGCDGVDNDGDGATDETGADGCDESYHVVVTLLDDAGFEVVDSTGVSFCDFRVLSSDPMDGAAGVDTLATVEIVFSRPALADSLTSGNVFIRQAGGGPVAATLTPSGDLVSVSIDPDAALLPDTTYEVVLTTDVVSQDGDFLDQNPCGAPAGWLSTFTTEPPSP